MDPKISLRKKVENVLIISLDCVRPEALGCYPKRFPWRVRVPHGSRTPNIDRLCAAGHRFDQAITQAPFTPAAHTSLFTGLNPPKHGVRKLFEATLDDTVSTLAERLATKGWLCGAIVGSGALSHTYGIDRGFHYYDDDIQTGVKNWILGQRRDAGEVTERAVNWLTALKHSQQFFLFVHYFDAHVVSHPFLVEPPVALQDGGSRSSVGLRPRVPEQIKAAVRLLAQPARRVLQSIQRIGRLGLESVLNRFEAGSRFEWSGRRYMLNQVAKIDGQVGRLIETLSSQDRLDKTLIIILADHGEDFCENGKAVAHAPYLYDTTLRVPLILYPRLGGRSLVEEQVRTVDCLPTVLSVLGLEPDNDLDGKSLVDLLDAPLGTKADPQFLEAYSETVVESADSGRGDVVNIIGCYASLRVPPWKLIWNRLDDTYELYRVEGDVSEKHNEISSNPDLASHMASRLRKLAQDRPVETESKDSVVIERLKGLGYL